MRILSVALLCCGLALVARPAPAQQWAEQMFDSLSHDFGPIARGAEVEHRFTIRNLYQEDVRIAGVRSSCGCTAPSVSQRLLKTHEEAVLTAKFDTVQFRGSHHATVTVTFDRPYFAEVRLSVQGFVRRDVVFTPGKVDFGSVSSGSAAERQISVAYAGRDDWKVVDVRSVNEHLEVEMQETQRGGGRVGYQLTIRLKPDAPTGYLNTELVLVTNDSAMTQVPLVVEGRIAGQLAVSPIALHLGSVPPGTTVSRQLVVRGQEPFRVLRIECAAEGVEFQIDEESKRLHLIPVNFTAVAGQGKLLEQIRIVTDLPDQTAPVVTLQAEVE